MPVPPASAPILGAATLRALEATHAGDDLMERAGAGAASWAAELCASAARPVLVVAGPGNNGGDAFVTARLLHERFFDVRLVQVGEPDQLPPDARKAFDRLAAIGVTFLPAIPDIGWGLVIDGLFGIGLGRPVAGRFAEFVRGMNEAAARSGCPLLALDCPSGIDSETGRTLGQAVLASQTLTFIGLKPGLLTGCGPAHAGTIRVDSLGLAIEPPESATDGRTIGRDTFADVLRPRNRVCHKGTFGSAGVLGGAPGMVGAAWLAGSAALGLGAGRVFVGQIDPGNEGIAAVDPVRPELMLRRAQDLFAAPLTALAVGPGMGTSDAARALLAGAIAADIPLVVDADGINLLAGSTALRSAVIERSRQGRSIVLTPHPMEAARLLDIAVDNLQENRLDAARRIAAHFGAWIVLKGAGSIVAAPDGRWWINTSGNPALASAGTGDVLTGFIVSLLAQGHEAGAALRCAVHLHGAAADAFAEREGGEIGLAASELVPIARRIINHWVSAHRVRGR